jgi:hypothetical protein
MALKINLQVTPYGQLISLSDVVVKVVGVTGTKEIITATIEFRKDDALIKNEMVDLPASVADGAENFIKQAYNQLKTLPDYSGAVDC